MGGRDELSGGTWLAVNEHGVCAGLTNQPLGDAKDPTKRSRGELPLAAARCATAAAGVGVLARDYDPAEYNGAWLLVGDRDSLYFVDFTGAQVSVVELAPGIHVLENRAVDDPSPKADLVREVVGAPGSGGHGGRCVRPGVAGPPGPRGGRASERGDVRASRHVRHTFVVPGAGGGK